MRSRNIKPGFFKNCDLADAGPHTQLLFAGLWCLADCEGRLEDKPRVIKAELFPYYDCDVNGELTVLQRLGFIQRYSTGAQALIQITNFHKHQSPHHTEKKSELPAYDAATHCLTTPREINGEATVSSRKSDGGNPPDSLIPDSLVPIPDSKALRKASRRSPRAPPITADTWTAYTNAYVTRYGVPPTVNRTTNSQMAQFVDRIGAQDAPHVAAFFVSHNNGYYVQRGHVIGALLSDAEKLRTEWATNRKVTQTQARQADQTASNPFLQILEDQRATRSAAAQ